MKRILQTVSVLASATIVSASVGAFSFRVTGNYPNAYITQPRNLNSSQTIVGYYIPQGGFPQGFVEVGKRFRAIAPPGSLSSYAQGINDKGAIVGGYCDTLSCNPGEAQHGFMLSGGTYEKIDYPVAGTSLAAEGINNIGQIVGGYCPASLGCITGLGPSNHAFLLDHGVYTTLDYPAAIGTQANAINDAGNIAGFYEDASTKQHGYLYVNGVFTSLDFPSANWTFAAGIDNVGTVSGSFQDANLIVHGFVYSGGVYTQVDVPGSFSTAIGGINNKGQIIASANINNATTNFMGTPVQ